MLIENNVAPTLPDTDYVDDVKYDELREKKRRAVLWSAILHIGDHEFDCQIRNFSMGGIKLKLNLPFKEGTAVGLEIPMRDITLRAEIAWQNDGVIGLRFLDDEQLLQGVFGDRADGMGVEPKVVQSNYRKKISSLKLT